jgi:hypothetical protein
VAAREAGGERGKGERGMQERRKGRRKGGIHGRMKGGRGKRKGGMQGGMQERRVGGRGKREREKEKETVSKVFHDMFVFRPTRARVMIPTWPTACMHHSSISQRRTIHAGSHGSRHLVAVLAQQVAPQMRVHHSRGLMDASITHGGGRSPDDADAAMRVLAQIAPLLAAREISPNRQTHIPIRSTASTTPWRIIMSLICIIIINVMLSYLLACDLELADGADAAAEQAIPSLLCCSMLCVACEESGRVLVR